MISELIDSKTETQSAGIVLKYANRLQPTGKVIGNWSGEVYSPSSSKIKDSLILIFRNILLIQLFSLIYF